MTNIILMLILSSPITLMPLMHLVTGYEGNCLLVTTVFTLIVLLVLTIVLENCNE
jgi:heme/copper-type cytochrome/quinol oxidase subunit 4